MTDADKTQIIKLKANGYGYKKIAAELGFSGNTIKSFLKRNSDSLSAQVSYYSDMIQKILNGGFAVFTLMKP